MPSPRIEWCHQRQLRLIHCPAHWRIEWGVWCGRDKQQQMYWSQKVNESRVARIVKTYPLSKSQIFTSPCIVPAASNVRLSFISTASSPPSCPSNTWTHESVVKSQTRTVPSSLADTRVLSKVLSIWMRSRCPMRVERRWFETASQTMMLASFDPEMMIC